MEASDQSSAHSHRLWLRSFIEQLPTCSTVLPPKFIPFLRLLADQANSEELSAAVLPIILSALGALPAKINEYRRFRDTDDTLRKRASLCALAQQVSSAYIATFENASASATEKLIEVLLDKDLQFFYKAQPARSTQVLEDGEEELDFGHDLDWSKSPVRTDRTFFSSLFVFPDEMIDYCEAFCKSSLINFSNDSAAMHLRMTLNFVLLALSNMISGVPVAPSERISWLKRLAELMRTFYGVFSDVLMLKSRIEEPAASS
ncbi:hypothetical protein RvY_05722 [Ramazzottius varieornatus]|uniref:Uncharacterized protein n=1 Tax=Ramazzottius varieornatus TaxID=947166 RepID=A0A1D1UWJ3_RAMVA|nr:hypothetical protein RvY_05722 [Ramazzottius varieornatus]